jgi:hypothetical protein
MNIRFLFVLVLALPTLVFAEDQGFRRTVQRAKIIENAEWISRNPAIGLYRGERIEFKRWIQVDSTAYLGIDEEGRAIQIVHTPTRTLAFLLSGERKIKDLFLWSPSLLLAIDAKGEILRFRWPTWKADTWSQKRDRLALEAGLIALGLNSAAGILAHLYHVPLLGMEVMLAEASGLVGIGFLQAYRGALAYERMNDSTDGFVSVGQKVAGFESSQPVWKDGEIVDYRLSAHGTNESLFKLIERQMPFENDPQQHFGYKCEHDLLPQGIPPGEYEPQL